MSTSLNEKDGELLKEAPKDLKNTTSENAVSGSEKVGKKDDPKKNGNKGDEAHQEPSFSFEKIFKDILRYIKFFVKFVLAAVFGIGSIESALEELREKESKEMAGKIAKALFGNENENEKSDQKGKILEDINKKYGANEVSQNPQIQEVIGALSENLNGGSVGTEALTNKVSTKAPANKGDNGRG